MNSMNELDNYELGNAYYEDIPEEEFEKYATMFGEGSESLSNLILFCWRNGIKTYTSCKGWHVNDKGPGYIGFLPDEELAKYLIELADQLRGIIIEVERYSYSDSIQVFFRNCGDYDFQALMSLIQRYVSLRRANYRYNNRFADTDRILSEVADGSKEVEIINGVKHLYELKLPKSECVDGSNDESHSSEERVIESELIERRYYCPNATITHILHSKMTRAIDKAFTPETDSTGIHI